MTKEERELRREQREHMKRMEAAAKEAGRGPIDVPFLLLVLLLTGVGLIILLSASFPSAYYESGDPLYYFKRQAAFATLGLAAMVVVASILCWIFAFIMGSGNAAFFSFAPLLPSVAKTIGSQVIDLVFPIQVILSFGRVSSPITGAIVAIAGLAGVSPFQIAKRTCIPMLFATVATYIAYFVFYYPN